MVTPHYFPKQPGSWQAIYASDQADPGCRFWDLLVLCSPARTQHRIWVPTDKSGPSIIAARPDGNLWFTESGTTANKIGRITLAGKITEFPLSQAKSSPTGIVVGPDGNLWFTEGNGNKIGNIIVGK